MSCRRKITIVGTVSIISLIVGMSWSQFYGYHKGQKEFYVGGKKITTTIKSLDDNNTRELLKKFYVLEEKYKFERRKLEKLGFLK